MIFKLAFLFIIVFIAGYYFGNKFNKSIFIKDLNLSHELSNFTSYSQFYEDLILFCIFYDVKNGFYIDIGANDPNIISVTKAFYIRGWYGINIEPLPNKFQDLVNHRLRDINLQIGAGKQKGNETLYVDGFHSTLSKEYSGNTSNIIKINIDTMLNVCKKYIPNNKIIHFCKIDVEGRERDVLLGYDFENYRPKVFCIESTKPDTLIFSYDEWEDILLKNDYSYAFQYMINRYYIDNRIQGLREKFIYAERILKNYLPK